MSVRRVLSGAVLGLAVVLAAAHAEFPRSRVYSRPGLPSAEMLRKLDLRLAWSTVVPMDGRRDGFLRVLIDGADLFVLSRSGQVARYDAETGRMLWKVRPKPPYTGSPPYLAANTHSVFTAGNATLYSLDRNSGAVRWQAPMPAGLAAGPAVNERTIFLPLSDGRVSAFRLPVPGTERLAIGRVTRAYAYGSVVEEEGPRINRPVLRWQEDTNLDLSYQPLLTPVSLLALSATGKARGYSLALDPSLRPEGTLRFEADGKVLVNAGQYGEMALIGSDDANLYALNMENGVMLWRYTAGTAVTRRPVALEQDVYVTSEREGMARLERDTGRPLWRIPTGRALLGNNVEADRFLAASERFVYAQDESNRLLVLDRRRGVRLAKVDITAFRFPIINEVTDRLYLAANDGTLLCLHDREQATPLRHRARLEVEARLERVVDVPRAPRDAKTLERVMAGVPVPLTTALELLKQDFGMDYLYRREALKAAGLADIEKRNVTFKEMNDQPLRVVYQDVLGQVNAELAIGRTGVEVVPARKEGKAPPKDPDPDKDKDKDKDD